MNKGVNCRTGNLVPRKGVALSDGLKHTQCQNEEIPLVWILAHLSDFEPVWNAAISREWKSTDDDAVSVLPSCEAFNI